MAEDQFASLNMEQLLAIEQHALRGISNIKHVHELMAARRQAGETFSRQDLDEAEAALKAVRQAIARKRGA